MVAVVFFALLSVAPARAAKAPVPDSDAQDRARALIKDVYGEEVRNATTPEKKVKTATMLLETAIGLKGDLPGQFVLMQTARNIAVSAGDLELTFKAIDAVDQAFQVNTTLYDKVQAFDAVAKAVRNDDQRKVIAESAVQLATAAQDAGQFDEAQQVASTGLTAAKRLRDKDLVASLLELERSLDAYLETYNKIKPALAVLQTQPADPDANLTVGRFRCFSEGKWDEGIPMLALGSDPDYQTVALSELGAPKDGDGKAKIADAWWDLSEKKDETKDVQILLRERAAHWYNDALAGLAGLAKKRVEKRLEDFKTEQEELAKAGGPAGGVRTRKKFIDKWLATGDDDGNVKIYDLTTGQVSKTLSGHRFYVYGVDFSPDGTRLVSCGYQGQVKLWDIESGKSVNLPGNSDNYVYAAKFSPNGKVIASASYYDTSLHVWDANTGKLLNNLSPGRSYLYAYDIAWSPDGSGLITAGSDDLVIWNMTTGRRSGLIDHRSSIRTCAFSPNGRHIVTAGYNKTINFFDTSTGNALGTLQGHTDTILSVAFSPDGKRLVSGSEDGTAKVWDVGAARGLMNLTGHGGYVYDVAYSPTGNLIATAGGDSRVIIWNAATGEQIKTFTLNDDVRAVAFAPPVAE